MTVRVSPEIEYRVYLAELAERERRLELRRLAAERTPRRPHRDPAGTLRAWLRDVRRPRVATASACCAPVCC
ncbi:hypothetical protein [Xylanimonas protaetiae]|uniref:Uncharacterized protein n=1 Tax=Xylanimonas protaetiae TaxID=2509457 RepID=A0A4P6F7W6_9MICO|nr:hypothetical protein [Xylanimonas protaetiae]QAY70963.1 hypothetical protein ET471_13775 [Xylanimonas protaetiae]